MQNAPIQQFQPTFSPTNYLVPTQQSSGCMQACMPSCQPQCIQRIGDGAAPIPQSQFNPIAPIAQQKPICLILCLPACGSQCAQQTAMPNPIYPSIPPYTTPFPFYPTTPVPILTSPQTPIQVLQPTAIVICAPACMPSCTAQCIQNQPTPITRPNEIQIDLPESIKQQPNCMNVCQESCIQQCVGQNYPLNQCTPACISTCTQTCSSAPIPLQYPPSQAYTQAPYQPLPYSQDLQYNPIENIPCQMTAQGGCSCPVGFAICVSGTAQQCCRKKWF